MVNIEKELFPTAYELKRDEDGVIRSVIVDDELDPYPCVYDGGGCFEIDTKDTEWITLSIPTLRKMIALLKKAQKMDNE